MQDIQPTEDSQVTAGFELADVHRLAKEDPNFLSAIAMPLVYEYAWPPIFMAIWSWLVAHSHKTRDFSKMAIGLPRGFAKTTMIRLFILYCILFTKKRFILILSNTATHAENSIADVFDMLSEPNIMAAFGDWRMSVETDTKSLKKFSFRGRDIIVAGIGAGGSVRGLNIKNARPDVMVYDDVQSREQADSEVESTGIYKWMMGTAMKARSPKGCLTVFIANMYPTPHSILKKLIANEYWIKYVTGAITEDGKSLWEDLHPLSELIAQYQHDVAAGTPEIFFSEVLNDPDASVNNAIDISKIPPNRFDDNETHQGDFVIIDPATDKVNADKVAIGYFTVFDGKPLLRKLTHDNLSPGACIRQALKYCLESGCRTVVIEGVAYQSTLGYWFKFICKQMGIEGIEALEIYPKGGSKNARIMTMFKSIVETEKQQAEQFLHKEVRTQVVSQITGFNPLKTNNKDGILDLLTYAPRVVTEFGEYIKRYTVEMEQDWDSENSLEYSEADNSPI